MMASDLAMAVIAVTAAGFLLFRLHRWLPGQWFLVRCWRWFSGAAHHGRPVTDAGWWRPGQRALTTTGHATRWHHLPRLHRAAWRTGGTLAVILLAWAVLAAPLITLAVVALLVAAALVAAVLRIRWLVAGRVQRRTLHYPLHLAAHELAGHPRAALARSWISTDTDDSGAVTAARLKLAPGWPADPGDRQRLVGIASAKLGIEAPEASWRLAGPDPLLTLTQSEPPPARVAMADLLEAVAQAGPDELILGIGKQGQVIRASMATDSPHLAISMGTGAGKSNLGGWLALQILMRGGLCMFLDAKGGLSYPWVLKDGASKLAQLPNIAYARTTAELHASMVWLSDELDRRNRVAFAGMDTTGRIRASVGPELFIIAEELNMAVPRLRRYWTDNKPDDAPGKSPAFTGLGETAFAGRQVRMHLVLIGQMLTAEATGSRDSSVKENCGIKMLSRYGPKGWRIMAEDVPMPPPPEQLGRVQVVTGKLVRETQTPLLDPVEARRLILAGDMALPRSDMPCTVRPAATVSPGHVLEPGSDQHPETVAGPVPVAPDTGPVTLREAVSRGLVHPETTLGALHMGRHRDPDFPASAGKRGRALVYDGGALTAWDMGRRS